MTIGVTLGVFMLSYVWLFETQWTITCQAPLSMEFPRQECWSGLPFPSPGDLPNPGMEPTFLVAPVLVSGFLTTCATWEAPNFVKYIEVNLTYPSPLSICQCFSWTGFSTQFTRTSTLSMSLPIQLLTHTDTSSFPVRIRSPELWLLFTHK